MCMLVIVPSIVQWELQVQTLPSSRDRAILVGYCYLVLAVHIKDYYLREAD